MLEFRHAPQRPVHSVRHGSVDVSVWKWCDGREMRFELTVNRALGEGEKTLRYPERFRAEHIQDLLVALNEAAAWVTFREEQLAQVRRLFKPNLALPSR